VGRACAYPRVAVANVTKSRFGVRQATGSFRADVATKLHCHRKSGTTALALLAHTCVCLVELESVEAHSYRIRTHRRSAVVGAFSHFDTKLVLDRHATTMASDSLCAAALALCGRTPREAVI
jgi:hypothetical protein